MKRIRKLILIGLIGGIFIMSGCWKKGKTKEDLAKELLRGKYNEEFTMHSFNEEGDVFYVTCSPIQLPEIVFEARIEQGDTPTLSDDYLECYVADKIDEVLRNDLGQYFPNLYVHTKITLILKDEIIDITGRDIESIISKKAGGDMYVEIYYDESVPSPKMYNQEYEYFTNTIDEYVRENKMLPITVHIYKVHSESIPKIEEYYRTSNKGGTYRYKEIICDDIYSYSLGDCSKGQSFLGNPPNISACFNHNYEVIESKKEYIRRRELLDNE